MSRAVYEVVPVADGWLIRMPGNSASELHGSKVEAIARARELGRRCDEWHVRVLATNGRLETELSSSSAPPTS